MTDMMNSVEMVRKQNGSSSLYIVSITLVCIFLLLAVFELCCIYIAREETKAVAEAVVLAVAQELIFLDTEELEILAEKIAAESGLHLSHLHIGYDEVEATLEKDTHISILGKIGIGSLKTVSSSSLVKIIYPWDRRLGLCDYYEFGFKPY